MPKASGSKPNLILKYFQSAETLADGTVSISLSPEEATKLFEYSCGKRAHPEEPDSPTLEDVLSKKAHKVYVSSPSDAVAEPLVDSSESNSSVVVPSVSAQQALTTVTSSIDTPIVCSAVTSPSNAVAELLVDSSDSTSLLLVLVRHSSL